MRVPLRLAPVFDRCGLRALLAGRRRWRGLVVLAHHRVGDARTVVGHPGQLSVDEETLDRQLQILRRDADLIEPAALHEARSHRGRAVLLTFDDGYADARATALPILQAHGAAAVFFIATGFIDRPRLPWWDELTWIAERAHRPAAAGDWTAHYKQLGSGAAERYLDELARRTGVGRAPASAGAGQWCDWDDVRTLRDAGMTIGAHTHDHPVLARAPAERQRHELCLGMDRIEAETGARPRWLAYPVGQRASFSETTRRVAQEAGIELAFSSYGGWNPWSELDRYDVRRMWVPADPARLRARVLAPRLFA
ncbi:MAG: polysaccharide deacetylase [Solirubrobacterales bacterium]|nr:polysaccharide deacetylase [Solirubrobacterales bacterium]